MHIQYSLDGLSGSVNNVVACQFWRCNLSPCYFVIKHGRLCFSKPLISTSSVGGTGKQGMSISLFIYMFKLYMENIYIHVHIELYYIYIYIMYVCMCVYL